MSKKKTMTNAEARDWIKERLEYHERMSKRDLAMRCAIDALEKSIPKVPTGKAAIRYCPNCRKRIRSGEGFGYVRIPDTYCARCGQALDWEGLSDRRWFSIDFF